MKSGLILLTLILLALPITILTSTATTTTSSNTVNWKVTINIVGGSGTITAIEEVYNTTAQEWNTIAQFTISHSTSFLVPNGTFVYLKSNESFIVNNGGMITKYYGIWAIHNETLTVNFNVQNATLPISEYIKVNIVLNNSGNLTVLVGNWSTQTLYTNITINGATTLEVPPDSVIVLSSVSLFRVNGSPELGITYYRFFATKPTTAIITFVNTNQSSTSTSTSTTATNNSNTNTSTTNSVSEITATSMPTNTTVISISAHTSPVLETTTSKNENMTFIFLIAIVLVIIFITYLIIKRNNK